MERRDNNIIQICGASSDTVRKKMSFAVVVLLLLTAASEVTPNTSICFDETGCLDILPPWTAPQRQLPNPLPPEELPIKMDFFSRENPDGIYGVNLTEAPIKPSRPTVVIAHDHEDDGNTLWIRSLKDAYLGRTDANILMLDWELGTVGFRYDQAAANIRVIGKIVAKSLQECALNFGLSPEDFHLIGEGLGAHLMGFIAKDFPGLGRITGLDPTREFFELEDPRFRLDKTDANFVDVVHTGAILFPYYRGLGLLQPIGHVDFYVNIGGYQPGCEPVETDHRLDWLFRFKSNNATKLKADICNHKKARVYFLQAIWKINNCSFWGHKLFTDDFIGMILTDPTEEELHKAKPSFCTDLTCTPIGLETAMRYARGLFFVRTRKVSPYCIAEDHISFAKAFHLIREKMETFISDNINGIEKKEDIVPDEQSEMKN